MSTSESGPNAPVALSIAKRWTESCSAGAEQPTIQSRSGGAYFQTSNAQQLTIAKKFGSSPCRRLCVSIAAGTARARIDALLRFGLDINPVPRFDEYFQ